MPRERRVPSLSGKKVDARVAARAARQWSIVDTDELHALGLTDKAIFGRVRHGLLHPLHRGVYAWGHPNVALEGCFLAAVKACGPDAVLSHHSAAVLWGLLRWDGRYPEVTAPTPRRHPGIHTHRSDKVERGYRKGIPVTPVIRVLMDLAGTRLPDKQLRRAVSEALVHKLIKPHEIITARHRGAKRLRAILADAAPTRNEFEDAVHALLKGLPKPDVNQRQGAYVPDFRWPRQRLILEADGEQFHGHILARAADRARQEELEADGWRFERVTWTQLTREPLKTRARIERALSSTVAVPT
jgi:very-short-patch-repair endonuclease